MNTQISNRLLFFYIEIQKEFIRTTPIPPLILRHDKGENRASNKLHPNQHIPLG